MDKQKILSDYKKQEDKILLAQILDKMEFSKQREKLIVSDTVNDYQTEAYLYGQKVLGSFSDFITPLPQNFDGAKALTIFSVEN